VVREKIGGGSGGLEESGVSQKEYVRKQREILASLIVLQEEAKKVVAVYKQ
jgi:hypothetical protein